MIIATLSSRLHQSHHSGPGLPPTTNRALTHRSNALRIVAGPVARIRIRTLTGRLSAGLAQLAIYSTEVLFFLGRCEHVCRSILCPSVDEVAM
jgi:hypothetical protein